MKEEYGPVTQAAECCGADVAMADPLERSLDSSRRRSAQETVPAQAEQGFDASGALVCARLPGCLPSLLPLSEQCACACRLVSWLSWQRLSRF